MDADGARGRAGAGAGESELSPRRVMLVRMIERVDYAAAPIVLPPDILLSVR